MVVGLAVFGFAFAVISSLHSYLILAYAGSKKAAEDVGFYYAANAAGRLIGILLSGLLTQYGSLPACLWGSAAMLALCLALVFLLPSGSEARGDVLVGDPSRVSEVSGAGDGRSRSSERINGWHMLAHAVAFCVAAAIGGILVYPSYPRFQAHTDTAGEAFGAFLTCCVIAGGIGPLVTLCLIGVYRLLVRARG